MHVSARTHCRLRSLRAARASPRCHPDTAACRVPPRLSAEAWAAVEDAARMQCRSQRKRQRRPSLRVAALGWSCRDGRKTRSNGPAGGCRGSPGHGKRARPGVTGRHCLGIYCRCHLLCWTKTARTACHYCHLSFCLTYHCLCRQHRVCCWNPRHSMRLCCLLIVQSIHAYPCLCSLSCRLPASQGPCCLSAASCHALCCRSFPFLSVLA